MKKSIKVILSILLLLNIIFINCYADDFFNLKESLNNIGINEEYSENIAEYLSNLNLSKEQINDLSENTSYIFNIASEKNSIDEFSLVEFYEIYNNGIAMADILNLGVDVDLYDRNLEVVDKKSDNLLFKGDLNDLKDIYSNYINNDYSFSLNDISEMVSDNELKDEEISQNIDEEEENNENEYNNIKSKNNNQISNEREQDDIDKYIDEIKSESVDNGNDNLDSNKIFIASAGALLVIILIKMIFFR